jgi:hypothetical protein
MAIAHLGVSEVNLKQWWNDWNYGLRRNIKIVNKSLKEMARLRY